MSRTKKILALLIFAGAISACKKDNNVDPAKTTVEHIEIGSSNNEIGVIGKDFHFNADIIAGDKIDNIQIRIIPKSGETYAKPWQYELTWNSYKGLKNTNVHKHFTIPEGAAEGKYDFIIVVNEENGTKLEIKKSLNIYLEANLPVNPYASIFNVFINDARYYRNGAFSNPGTTVKKNEILTSQMTISGVKGEGKMYILLINKKLNHRPESIDKIDFSKAIVYDVFEHKDWATVGHFSNSVIDPVTYQSVRNIPKLTIGATSDNNLPIANGISGTKAWESGTYYYGVVYHNTTFNIGFYQYIELTLDFN
jgi:hypothetical protein